MHRSGATSSLQVTNTLHYRDLIKAPCDAAFPPSLEFSWPLPLCSLVCELTTDPAYAASTLLYRGFLKMNPVLVLQPHHRRCSACFPLVPLGSVATWIYCRGEGFNIHYSRWSITSGLFAMQYIPDQTMTGSAGWHQDRLPAYNPSHADTHKHTHSLGNLSGGIWWHQKKKKTPTPTSDGLSIYMQYWNEEQRRRRMVLAHVSKNNFDSPEVRHSSIQFLRNTLLEYQSSKGWGPPREGLHTSDYPPNSLLTNWLCV